MQITDLLLQNDIKFFKLLRFSIDPSQPVPDDIKAEEWPMLFRIAKEQNLQGVIFYGMKRLPEHCLPDRQFRMKWFAISRQIATLNTKVNVNAVKVSEIFRQKGLRTCILKGQGNALIYPDPLMRTPGDIDIWAEGGYKKVMKTVGKWLRAISGAIITPTFRHTEEQRLNCTTGRSL